MSSVHTFVEDVFISYRHLDNELLDEHEKGWVDNFHERFAGVLGEALGYEPSIWRDPRLPGNVYFADVLEERIRNTAVVISIVSPGYLQSEWCIGELREFCREQGLAQWKIPREIRVVADLPRSPTGKVVKRMLT